MIKVLVTDPLEKEGIKILEKANFKVDQVGKLPPEKLSEIIGDYDVIVVRSGTKVTREVIRKGKRLKIIGRAGVGLDNIDVEEATRSGIIVMNAPEGNTISAAEHTIGMLLAVARNIPQANVSVKEKKWEKKKFMGTELYGKVLGIIGFGRIGKRVAHIAKAFGMKILCYDPYIDVNETENLGVSSVSLEGLLRQADFLTFHLPLNEETYHMIGKKEFEMMKDGVIIVNVARGGIIDEEALYEYIKKGKVKAVAIDVFEKEPPQDNKLLQLDQVIATPHLGASTKEAQVNVARNLASQIVDALTKKIVKNAVNLPTVDEKFMEKFRGYLSLGEKIGSLLNQLKTDSIRKIKIEYQGEITNYDLSLLRSYILCGILMDEKEVNLVNAPLVLKEKGILIEERRKRATGEFSTLISVEVKGKESISAAGTLIENSPKIVKINGFSVEATPEGVLLVCYNEDKPGIMGHIGTVLGRNEINIASMTLGRKRKGGPAITVLNLDEKIDNKILKEIEEFPAINTVRLVKL